MQQYVWDIDQDDKEELFRNARFRVNSSAELYDIVGITKQTAKSHRDGKSPTLGILNAARLLRVVNSEPVFDLTEPLDTELAEPREWQGKETVSLDDFYKSFLLGGYDRNTLKEETGYSKTQINNYRRKGNNIPRDLYEWVFYDTKEKFNAELSITGDIYKTGEYSTSKAYNTDIEPIFDEADSEEVIELAKVVEGVEKVQKSNNKSSKAILGIAKNRFEELDNCVDKIVRKLEANGAYLSGYSGNEGRFLNLMEQLDMVEQFGGEGSAYRLDVEPHAFEVFREEVRRFREKERPTKQINYSKDDLREFLEDIKSNKDSDTNLKDYLEENKSDCPSYSLLVSRFGSGANVKWLLGEEPVRREYDQLIVGDMVRSKSYDLGGKKPVRQDFREDPDMPSPETIRRNMTEDGEEMLPFAESLERAGVKYDREELMEEVLENLYDGKWQGRDLVENNAVYHRSAEGFAD